MHSNKVAESHYNQQTASSIAQTGISILHESVGLLSPSVPELSLSNCTNSTTTSSSSSISRKRIRADSPVSDAIRRLQSLPVKKMNCCPSPPGTPPLLQAKEESSQGSFDFTCELIEDSFPEFDIDIDSF